MSNTLNWSSEQLPGLPGRSAAFEASLDSDRIDALKDLVVVLLRELEALRLEAPSRLSSLDRKVDLQTRVQEFECDLIRRALQRARGNQAQAARLLGVKHTTLNAKIHRYKISPADPAAGRECVVSDHVTVA